jgi:hypothetical protein
MSNTDTHKRVLVDEASIDRRTESVGKATKTTTTTTIYLIKVLIVKHLVVWDPAVGAINPRVLETGESTVTES